MPVKEEIEKLAYSLSEREGRPNGSHLRHYYEAERLLAGRERDGAVDGRTAPSGAATGEVPRRAGGANPTRRAASARAATTRSVPEAKSRSSARGMRTRGSAAAPRTRKPKES